MVSMPYPWYSPYWFSPAVLTSYEWARPVFLWLIPGVPILLLARSLVLRFLPLNMRVAVLSEELKSSPLMWFRLVPDVIVGLILTLIFVALARPQKTNQQVEQWSEGIDIVLAIDISQSMQIQDFQPNRLEAAKRVASDFIRGRIQDRIGVVVFSGDAFSLAPLTTDYKLLQDQLADISFDMIEHPGTAIGSAVAVATNRMAESDAKSKVCILISDGDNTAGNIDPLTAAKLAAAYGIKLYTIVVGREGLVPLGKDYFGRPQMVENTIDETTMREIAKIGSGEFFRAGNNTALKRVFSIIDRYEKVKIKQTQFKDVTDFYAVYLRWALVLFLFWLFLKSTFMVGLLYD